MTGGNCARKRLPVVSAFPYSGGVNSVVKGGERVAGMVTGIGAPDGRRGRGLREWVRPGRVFGHPLPRSTKATPDSTEAIGRSPGVMMPGDSPALSSEHSAAYAANPSLGDYMRLRHVICVRCRRHVAAVQFMRRDYVNPANPDGTCDSWGGMFFDSPGFLCDCCLNECPNCRRGNE